MNDKLMGGNILRNFGSKILMAGTLGILVTSCAAEAGQETAVCSPIVKIKQIDRPLSWGERTLDEVSAKAKFRSVYLLQTQNGREMGHEPIEVDLRKGFDLEVGEEYCA